jgi:CBS domain-containing protein
MNVASVMTPSPLSVGPDAHLEEAARAMDRSDVRHLVVVESGGGERRRVVGVLSDRDLLAAPGWRRSADRGEPDGSSPLVRDVMHAPVVSVRPDDSVVMAAVELTGRGIGCLPVMDGERLVGILTEIDLLAAFRSCAREGRRDEADPLLEDRMQRSVITVQEDATLAEAIDLCEASNVRHLPVVRDGTLAGILSDRDLRRAMGERRDPQAPVTEVMTSDVLTLPLGARLSEAARLMVANRVSSVPVVDDGELVGIVTSTDLLDQCMETLREV